MSAPALVRLNLFPCDLRHLARFAQQEAPDDVHLARFGCRIRSRVDGDKTPSYEELTTLIEELENRNSELVNLLTSVEIPIVMLDNELRIRRFNPVAQRKFDGAVLVLLELEEFRQNALKA